MNKLTSKQLEEINKAVKDLAESITSDLEYNGQPYAEENFIVDMLEVNGDDMMAEGYAEYTWNEYSGFTLKSWCLISVFDEECNELIA